MLGWILLGLAAVGTIIAVTIELLQDAMRERGVESAVVEQIDRCNNRVKLRDLEDSWYTFTVEGDEVSDEIYHGQTIYA